MKSRRRIAFTKAGTTPNRTRLQQGFPTGGMGSDRHFAWQQPSGTECPLWVKSRHSLMSDQCPLYPRKRTLELSRVMSALCRFCCRSPLQAFLVGDSVAVTRFATGTDHDGAAESRPGTVFLFISSR